MSDARRFTCEDAFRRLDDYLDRELSAEETRLFREHLDVCAECLAEYRFEAGVRDGVRAKARAFRVPDDLVARVLAHLPTERPGRPPSAP